MIVRNSITEKFKRMPAKTAEEVAAARETLINTIMCTKYENDDDDNSATRQHLRTLSNDNLQDLVDGYSHYFDDAYDGVRFGYGQVDESFTYLKPKTKEELKDAMKQEEAKALTFLEKEIDVFIDNEWTKHDDMYTYGYWMRYIFISCTSGKRHLGRKLQDKFFKLCERKAKEAGAEWEAWDEVEFKEGWESNS